MRKRHPLDLCGIQFDKLTVLSLSYVNTNNKQQIYNCQCECGRKKEVRRDCLLQKRTRSCGCLAGQLDNGEASLNRILDQYKRNAKNRGYSFDLHKEDFRIITKQNCFYCGQEPSNVMKGIRHNGAYVYNGIDRIDNDDGYNINNCVACCSICNNAKRNLTLKEFNNWISRIKKHSNE